MAIKLCFFKKLLFLSLLSLLTLPNPAYADREFEIAKVLQQTEAQDFAYEYITDLRSKIRAEKYETIPPVWERFALRQTVNLKNETAYRIVDHKQLTKIRNQLILSETGKFSDYLRFKFSGRLYYDLVYNLTRNYPGNVRSDMGSEAELRDTYLDYSNGPWDLRLGKQEIAWGEAIALFFTDVVNAKDLREFILPDLNMIRIPQWGANLEFSKNDFHAELVWFPVLEFDKQAVTGSDFAYPLPLPSTNTPYTYVDPNQPKNSFNNSEAGLRLSYFSEGWDLSLLYLHGWQTSPIYYRTINSGVYNFNPTYKRLDIIGATFGKEIKDIVFKGEFAFHKNDYFSVTDSSVPDGVLKRSYLYYLLGADYTFFNKISFNLQFMQKVIFDYTKLIEFEDKVGNMLSFWIKTGFFNNRLEPELIVAANLMEYDAMFRPALYYKINDNWKVKLGGDFFGGKTTGTFGIFDKKSRIYSEVSCNF